MICVGYDEVEYKLRGAGIVSEHWQKVPGLRTRLYEITDELENMFGRKFTPDGHLVGSLGEAMAVYSGID
jgi:hypothetical protein